MNVVWKPLPGSQTLGLTAPVNHILLHGTRGGGKTDVQPMRFRRHVGQGYGQFWRGIIFDREYKALDDIIAKTKRHFPKFGDGAKFLSGQGQYTWKWPTGEELLFRVMKNPDDYLKYHGQEYPFIGFNELTKYPTADCYELIQSCNRSSFIPEKHSPDRANPLPEIPLEVVSTTNPSGPGHNWVKRRFIDPAPDGKILRRHSKVFNPRTQQEEVVTKTQVSIFSSYKENIYLPPEYVADLQNITDPNKKAAWLEGDWDVTAGGALDDIWDSKVHILDRFEAPKSWRLTRSFDWGSSHPFSVMWWTVSNGEEVLINGKRRSFPRGSLIGCAELYGAEDRGGDRYGHNHGLKWSARKVAQETKKLEEELMMLGWFPKKPQPGPADSQIYAVNEAESGCIGDIMAKEGIKWTPADKRPGTRKNGLQIMRDMLENAVKGEGPGLYVMRNCQAFINTVPGIPRDSKDPDDVDTEAIDHCFIAGTMVETQFGRVPIESIREGDLVWTREGLKPVIETHKTKNQVVFDVTFEGGQFTGTGNHPVWVNGEGWKRIDLLTQQDRLTPWNHQEKSKAKEQSKNSTGLNTTIVGVTSKGMVSAYTGLFGRLSMVRKSLTNTMFTTLTGTGSTTTQTTCRSFMGLYTFPFMGKLSLTNKGKPGQRIQRLLWKETNESQKSKGLRLQKLFGWNAKNNTQESLFANNVAKNMKLSTPVFQSSVTKIANKGLCIKDVEKRPKPETVYNITVSGCHEYFANGVLVHNCYDATRYMVLDARPDLATSVNVGFAS